MGPTTSFSVKSSLVSLNNGDVPNFARPTPVYLERTIDGSLQLYPIAAHHPAFYSEDGAFLLEPATANLVTHNLDLSQSAWLKGSNVSIRADYSPAPDTSYRADRLRWDTGNGASQVFKRSFLLEAGESYFLSAIVRLPTNGGTFSANDLIRVVGGVAGTPKIGLSTLNAQAGKYVLLELPFTAAGKQPTLPGNPHQIQTYSIATVNPNSLVIVIPNGYTVSTDDLKGGLLRINNKEYQIVGNTAIVGGQVTVTTVESTLVLDGVLNTMKATIGKPNAVEVWVEFYSESTATLDWGGMQLEQKPFRTSMIYQNAQIIPRASTLLSWRKSPTARLKTLGFFCELREWRGDGGLFDFGNLRGSIENGKLVVVAESVEIALTKSLPKSAKIFVQIQESNSSLSVYVNGILEGRSTLNNFRGSQDAPFTLSSDGVRVWQQLFVRETATLEGQTDIGQEARQGVAELFKSSVLIDSVAISSHAPIVLLPKILVPPAEPPIAESEVVGIGGNSITLRSGIGFVPNSTVQIIRGNTVILNGFVNGVSGNTLTLVTSAGAILGDRVIYGDRGLPGSASVRFPCDPIDPQIISAIDSGNKRITVGSVLSFVKSRAFIRNQVYQDIAEVLVSAIDQNANTLTLDSVAGLVVGMTIYQPKNELWIEPANYLASSLEDLGNVIVGAECYRNGLVVHNYNPFAVEVTPQLRVYL